MNKDQIKGNIKDAAGKLEKEAGKLVGSVKHQINGAILQTEGKAQKHLGDVERAAKDTRHALNKATSEHI